MPPKKKILVAKKNVQTKEVTAVSKMETETSSGETSKPKQPEKRSAPLSSAKSPPPKKKMISLGESVGSM